MNETKSINQLNANQASPSLAQEVGVPSFELFNTISRLTPFEPGTITTRKQVIDILRPEVTPPNFDQLLSNVKNLVKNLIFRQFPHPVEDAIRELLSNAIDAQIRAHRMEFPVKITIENDTLQADDYGDGIDWSKLINIFVAGRTSNDGVSEATGRFGQGKYALFYFLAYSWSKLSMQPPQFRKNEKNELELEITFQVDNKPHKVVFTAEQEENGVKIVTHATPIQASESRKKLSIHSLREDEGLKMKFQEVNGTITFDIADKDKKERGSSFKIQSPLISSSKESIISNLKKTFRFVLDTPIFVNNEQINPPQAYQKIEVGPGMLLFPAHPTASNEGTATICERGKCVLEVSTKQAQVLQEVAISFSRLPLSPERATVDFKHPASVECMRKVIAKIFEDESLSWDLKALLLNSLYPLISEEGFDLIIDVKNHLLKYPKKTFLPDTPELRAFGIKDAIFLHSGYIDRICLSPLYTQGNCNIYLTNSAGVTPIATVTTLGTHHLFLDNKFFDKNSMLLTLFNVSLMNLWYANVNNTPNILNADYFKQKFFPLVEEENASSASSLFDRIL